MLKWRKLTHPFGMLLFSVVLLTRLQAQADRMIFPFQSEIFIPGDQHFYMFDASLYAFIIDKYGTPVYQKYFEKGIKNFKPLTDSSYTCYLNREKAFLVLDQKFQAIDTLSLSGNFDVDFHSIGQIENGNILMLGSELQSVDLSETIWMGSPNTTIRGAVIQEIDQLGAVLYEWRSLDHLGITDSVTCLVDMASLSIDYIHLNSIQSDTDTTWIVSARNLNQVLRIHKESGQIIWRMGGIGNQFEFPDDPEGFSGQHSVYLHNNGYISMYDNGNCKPIPSSRGVVYDLDQERKIAEKVSEFYHDPPIRAPSMGNFSLLPENRSIVGWSKSKTQSLFTEFLGTEVAVEMSVREEFSYVSYAVSPVNWNFPIRIHTGEGLYFEEARMGDTLSIVILVSNDLDMEVSLVGMHFAADFFEFEEDLPLSIPPRSSIETRIRCVPTFEGNWETPLTIYAEFSDGAIHKPIAGSQVDVKLRVSGVSNIKSPTARESPFRLFPNPVENILNLETKIPLSKLRMYSNSGTLLASFGELGPGIHLLPTNHLASGNYILVMTGQDGSSHSEMFTKITASQPFSGSGFHRF